MFSKIFLGWSVLLILLAGCVPVPERYIYFDQSGAEYFGTSCRGGHGPPAVTYFPHGDIWLSVSNLEYSNFVIVGIHIPAGKTVQVLDKKLKIAYETTSGASIEYSKLIPAQQQLGNSEPDVFTGFTDAYGTTDFFGKLAGETKDIKNFFGSHTTAYKVYRFQAGFDPRRATKGTIILPAIQINGREIAGPTLHFERRTHIGIEPSNC